MSGWKKSTTVRIESNQPAIPYYCSLHLAERILIVVLPKDEGKMTNTQRLKFLARSIACSVLTGRKLIKIRTRKNVIEKIGDFFDW